MILRIGSWLWRVARHPMTLLALLAGCVALAALAATGILPARGADGVGLLARLAAGWLALTLVISAARAADECSTAVAAAGARVNHARRVAPSPTLTSPPAWVRRAVGLTGLAATAACDTTTPCILAARPKVQRYARACLYVGLAILAGWAAAALLWGQAGATGILLLGQPTPLGQTGLVLTLEEAAVVALPTDTLQLQVGQVRVQGNDTDRRVLLGPRNGALVGSRWLRFQNSLTSAGVRIEQLGGRVTTAYPIDGARPVGETARVWFTPLQQEQLVAAPGVGLLVRLVRYADTNDHRGGLYAEVLDGDSGAVLAEAAVSAPTTLSARGLAIAITPEIAVQVATQPLAERLLWYVAGIAIAMGAVAHVCWPQRRAWLAIADEGDIWLLDACALPWDRRWLERLAALLAVPRDGA